jgi:hypothetical protein
MENEKKNQLINLFLLYNLTSIISFPVRVLNTSAAAIDNIFIDISQFLCHSVSPVFNCLSDHDAQLLMISTDCSHMPTQESKTVRKIDMYMISDFINKLSNELWDAVFNLLAPEFYI